MEPKEPTEEDINAKCDEFAVKAGEALGDALSRGYWDLMLDFLVDENGQEN